MSEVLGRRYSDLSPEKRALLERMLLANGSRASRIPSIPKRTDPAHAPLSYAQQRMWFLEQLSAGTAAHNVDFAIRVKVAYNVSALERALNEIVRRHEALRTTFRPSNGDAIQVIAEQLHVPLPVQDLRHLPETLREEEAVRLATEEACEPFDLVEGPLLRTKLLRIDDADYLFLVTMHHIVSDYMSMLVFFEELKEIYVSFANGLPCTLPEPAVQYGDFATWQKKAALDGAITQQLPYWRKQLADVPILQLPTDRPRPVVASVAGAAFHSSLPNQLSGQVHAFSQHEAATVFMTLLAVFKTLLYRYTSQLDLVVGVPVANRNLPGLDSAIGFFVNSLVVRTDLSGDPTFRDVLARVRHVVSDAFANQDMPFEKLVEELQPERRLNVHPMFQVAFQYLPLKQSSSIAPRVWIERSTSTIDLAFELYESPEGVVIRVEYATALFDRQTISRLVEQYITLLESAMEDPNRRISELSYMSAEQESTLLHDWNETEQTFLPFLAHQLFERQVSETPHAPALLYADQCLSFEELNQRANQLARYLQQHGAGPEQIVGVFLERSFDLYTALLGIWKAGSAYLPLDPSHPQERLSSILANAQPKIVLTARRFVASLPQHEAKLVILDECAELIAAEQGANLDLAADATSAAYIIYTSGSTGKPKGVLVEHRAISNQLQWMQSAFPVSPNDCVLQKYPIIFDASIVEIFGALIGGASLFIVEPGRHMDIEHLANAICERGVTAFDGVPSLVGALLEEPSFVRCKSLRRIICGGEELRPDLLAKLRQNSNWQIVNMYGPTEAAVTASYWVDDDGPIGERVPIGRPISNCKLYILDKFMRPTPPGVPGELYIGGAGLARQYYAQPDLTRNAFVPNPFTSNPSARLYRTGDLARYLADGNIEFIGRNDTQVKIRGFRIEPSEIQTVLSRHAGVQQCAVIPERAEGGETLTAYVVPDPNPPELWPSVGEYFIYDQLLYHAMTSDTGRNLAYRAAMQDVVPGKIVADLGTGADAFLARLCIDMGAERVYAIEMLDEAFHEACHRIEQAGLKGKIIPIHGNSLDVDLPEKVDVCVSELIGTIASSEGVVTILNNAHRFLNEGGVMIPQRAITRIAAVSLPPELADYPTFSETSGYYTEKVFSAVGRPFDVRICIKHLPNSSVISEHRIFESLDFAKHVPEQSSSDIRLTIRRASRVDGLLLWLNLFPGGGVNIDTLSGHYSWLPVFFPVFYPGVPVSSGDEIDATCVVSPIPGQMTPDYRITGTLRRKGTQDQKFDYFSSHSGGAFRGDAFYRRLFPDNESFRRDGVASPAGLRAYLKQRLPDYMTPASFQTVNSLPLTFAGKLDRLAFKGSNGVQSPRPDAIPPRTELERSIAIVWQDVLKVDVVGIHDNFFDLGGHSLLLVKLHRRLKDVLRMDLSLTQLFQYPTVAALAGALSNVMPDAALTALRRT